MNKWICSSYKAGKSLTFLGDEEIIWTRILTVCSILNPTPEGKIDKPCQCVAPDFMGQKLVL